MEKTEYCMSLPMWHPRPKKKLWRKHKDSCYQKLGGRQGWLDGHRGFLNSETILYVNMCHCTLNWYILTHQEWTLRPTRDFEW